ncbi:MAG: hypothetical protein ACPGAN_03375 [Candidatus Poseidoniaceae archaeon]
MHFSDLVRPTMKINLWASLGYGAILLISPALFCEIIDATATNLSWLRTIGAALIGTNVVGSWLWLRAPSLDMGRVQLATAGMEAFAMTVSLALGEFTAQRIWMVQLSILLAIVVMIGLIPSGRRDFYNQNF